MCGIAGLISTDKIDFEILKEMVNSIHHRGPDDTGYYIDGNVGLGHSRLSIMDPENGKQPAINEDESVIVIFNGEIFNYRPLRSDLIEKGHIITNNSDTSILPHLYEEYGPDMCKKLNGQFAIAIWDKHKGELILIRDRLGEKPLYYCCLNGILCFASEVKAIFKSRLINASISPISLKQVFTYWTTLSNQSMFENVFQIPQGCYLIFKNHQIHIEPYWNFTYSKCRYDRCMDIDDYTNELDKKLRSAVETRMMSDVPISFYLSGGVDSSLITAIAARISQQRLNTFSIAFDDIDFDESSYQDYMSRYLETNHQRVMFSRQELPSLVKDVIFHTEVPLLRSGAFPMYVLARLVSDNNTKVVLSGEGSDELFGGYDIFREVKIREFCERVPNSKYRASLYKRVNNFVKGLNTQSTGSLSLYYNAVNTKSCISSHQSRWRLGTYSQQFFSSEYREQMKECDEIKYVEDCLPEDFMTWTPVQRAQYLEVSIFFSNYLLSSQGDRVSMAHSVECRYPFLDYEVVEFANSLPDLIKIRALNEKYIIKKLAQKYVPKLITERKKFPYRAPINISEFMKDEYVRYILSFDKLKQFGIFNPYSVEKFLLAVSLKGSSKERDCMLFMGILTTQILHDLFIA